MNGPHRLPCFLVNTLVNALIDLCARALVPMCFINPSQILKGCSNDRKDYSGGPLNYLPPLLSNES